MNLSALVATEVFKLVEVWKAFWKYLSVAASTRASKMLAKLYLQNVLFSLRLYSSSYYCLPLDQAGISPHSSSHHYDHPHALEDEYGGWERLHRLCRCVVQTSKSLVIYRIPYWTTMNEPNALAVGGYDGGFLPPGRCSTPFGINCSIEYQVIPSLGDLDSSYVHGVEQLEARMLRLSFLLIILLIGPLALPVLSTDEYSREDFPSGFIFGAGSSAYQHKVEGAADEDGRSPSVWDTFAHEGNLHGATGDVAVDEYHKYKEDVRIMAQIGLDAYRFSISWPRLIPNGRGPVNPKGLQYYNNLINELIRHAGIQPHVLLYNYDHPQALEDEYGGWGKQLGVIGISLFIYWLIPLTNSTTDAVATQRAQDFLTGWVADPLVFGDYPITMKRNVGSRLPAFTNHESKLVKGSVDFIGLIHYQAVYIEDNSISLEQENRDFNADMAVMITLDNSSVYEFALRPRNLQQILEYFKNAYGNPAVYVHENGLSLSLHARSSAKELHCQRTRRNSSLEDPSRVKYLNAYIGSVLDAIRNGSNARGYFVWSFLDGLELLDGYESSYGLYYVDLDDPDLKRYPKLSAHCAVALPVFSRDKCSGEDFPPGFVFGAGSSSYQIKLLHAFYFRTAVHKAVQLSRIKYRTSLPFAAMQSRFFRDLAFRVRQFTK
ncbi:unnamed protein product [Dovyalis caffra]|uniref:Beta-glucosidase n=1 Tax=Dovyalis caffra TaxID=77055 RepID=A0AAV1SD33_9ROSI|nr:unnamed protein product [Dovyalis caffra]